MDKINLTFKQLEWFLRNSARFIDGQKKQIEKNLDEYKKKPSELLNREVANSNTLLKHAQSCFALLEGTFKKQSEEAKKKEISIEKMPFPIEVNASTREFLFSLIKYPYNMFITQSLPEYERRAATGELDFSILVEKKKLANDLENLYNLIRPKK